MIYNKVMEAKNSKKKNTEKSLLLDLSLLPRKKLPTLTEFRKIKKKVSNHIEKEIARKENATDINLLRELFRKDQQILSASRH